MRTLEKLRTSRLYSVNEKLRLISVLVSLAVVGMLIWRASDPANWRWLTGEAAPAYVLPTEAGEAGPPLPPPGADPALPVGPTDEDPEELDAAKEEFQALSDGKQRLADIEMPAYWRLFKWTESQTMEQMQKRAVTRIVLNDFAQSADEQRGKLIRLDLNVRRVLEYDAPQNSVGITKVYEIWGWTEESRAWPYVMVTAHLPPGMPVGPNVHQKANFVGYFFKLQGYQAAGAGPKDKPLLAPLLIGRMSRPPVAAPPPAIPAEWSPWVMAFLGIATAWLVTRLAVAFWRRRRQPPEVLGTSGGEPGKLPGWLSPRGEAPPDHDDFHVTDTARERISPDTRLHTALGTDPSVN